MRWPSARTALLAPLSQRGSAHRACNPLSRVSGGDSGAGAALLSHQQKLFLSLFLFLNRCFVCKIVVSLVKFCLSRLSLSARSRAIVASCRVRSRHKAFSACRFHRWPKDITRTDFLPPASQFFQSVGLVADVSNSHEQPSAR
jgi:hypothetical protein